MPDYPVQEVLFNDGEGIDLADLNNMQRYLRAQSNDLLTASRARAQTLAEHLTGGYIGHLYGLGGAAPITSVTARTVTASQGVLLWHGSSFAPTGGDPQAIPFYVNGFELTTQLDIGDANPRIDLISIKLEHVSNDAADQEARTQKNYSTGSISTANLVKKRKAVLTKVVTKGTPAATPTVPATPGGYVPWCSVYVPALHNAVVDVENIRDQRFPLGFDRIQQPTFGLGAGIWAAAGWSALGSGPGLQSTAGATLYVAPPARSKHAGRLLRVGLMGLLTGCTVSLVRVNMDNTTSFGGETVLADISSSFTGGANQLYAAAESHANWSRPLWLNGFTGGVAAITNPKAAPNDARMQVLALKIVAPSSGKVLKFAEWDVASW